MMDPVTYEQVTVNRSLFGDQAKWLTDGMEVTLSILTDGEAVLGESRCRMAISVN